MSLAIVAVRSVYNVALLMFSHMGFRSWALAGCTFGEKVIAHSNCSQPDHTVLPEHTAALEYMVALVRTVVPDYSVVHDGAVVPVD